MNINNGTNGEEREAVEIAGRESTADNGNGRSAENGVSNGSPCGACRFLRRKCPDTCVFAPYFSSDDIGVARFSAVHKIFGCSKVTKLLLGIQQDRREEAISSICYEAEARVSDPAYGCFYKVAALEQQLQKHVSCTSHGIFLINFGYCV